MIFLSNAALRYAVNIAAEHPKYRIGIVTPNHNKLLIVENQIQGMVMKENIPLAYNRSFTNGFQLMFRNGSTIHGFHASDNFRGYSLHLMIADLDTPPGILNTVFRPMEKASMIEYQKHHTGTREFTNGFTTKMRFMGRDYGERA